MSIERTLAIIKPDAVAAGYTGRILARLEDEGFRIVSLKKVSLSRAQARAFYAVHRERPFYESLVRFMTSGPVVPIVLERENAIAELRAVMGATNSREAATGTLRNLYGTNIERNAIHGSDAPATAAAEQSFFFSRLESP